ncbi:MAG TPA: YhgE/Pip domain-containing protein [Bacillales bacterium]|nr:YhgE/Pip domain-containing protein [Bacillales bacterium]
MLTSLRNEFSKIIHNRKLLIAIIGVMTIPLLYSGTFLWAFWNPYGHLDRLPVAVVNQDEGATYNGKNLDIGHDLVENLRKKQSFKWQFVDEKKADKGLKNWKYYIKIEIPKDFSENATTLQSEHPKKLKVIYTPNEGFNYLSSKIGDLAIEKIKEEISGEVTKTYAASMFGNVKDIANGLNKASNGAGELYTGMNKAKTGAEDLTTGMAAAEDGSKNLSTGAESVYFGTKRLGQGLEILAENTNAFSNGVKSASNGSTQLYNGLQQFDLGLGQLKDGYSNLISGAEKSQVATKQLSDGLNLTVSKLPDLQNGSKQLEIGTTQLSSSLNEWNDGAQKVTPITANVNQQLQQVIQDVGNMIQTSSDPNEMIKLESLQESLKKISTDSQMVAGSMDQLAENASHMQQVSQQMTSGAIKLNVGQTQLADGLHVLASGAQQLQEGQNQFGTGLTLFGGKLGEAKQGISEISAGGKGLASGLTQLASGSVKLENGTTQLTEGSIQLLAGTTQLSSGTKSLSDGMLQLATGSSDLTSGIGKLSEGSKQLSNELHKGAKEVKEVKANDDVYNMFAKPVALKNARLNHVPDYGTGFTPYFLSLSLFVGALMVSIIFPMLKPAAEPTSGLSWFAGKLGVLLGVGIAQALLADIVLLTVLGLDVKSVPYFILLSIFTSWTFLAIIQFLVTVLDNPGRFLGIILLILQLTSSAGTYPIELVPNVLQKITNFLPMTYTIAGFRSVISTGDFRFMWENVAFISIFFVIFLAATLTFFVVKFNRNEDEKTCVAA